MHDPHNYSYLYRIYQPLSLLIFEPQSIDKKAMLSPIFSVLVLVNLVETREIAFLHLVVGEIIANPSIGLLLLAMMLLHIIHNPYHSDLVAVPSYLVSLILCLL
eukprot:640317_1